MRKVVFTVVCFVAATSLNAQSLKQFTGTWRVDPDKSQEKATPSQQNPNAKAPDTPPPPPSDHKYTLDKIQEAGPLLKISGGEAGTMPYSQSIQVVKKFRMRFLMLQDV